MNDHFRKIFDNCRRYNLKVCALKFVVAISISMNFFRIISFTGKKTSLVGEFESSCG